MTVQSKSSTQNRNPWFLTDAEFSPIAAPRDAALNLAQSPAYWERVITRAEYLEGGSSAVRRKFGGWNVDMEGNEVQTGTNENQEDWDVIKDKRGGGGASVSARRGPGRPRKRSLPS